MNKKIKNMENFKDFQPSPEIKKPALWKKIRKPLGMAALATLLSLPIFESAAQAQEKGETKDTKVKIEQLTKEAKEQVIKISITVKEKGQAGKMGETLVRRLISEKNKQTITVGYDKTGNKEQWVIGEDADASMRYYDQGADGSVNKVIINKEQPKSGSGEKSAFNDLKTFSSMENLADEASVSADLLPENVKVYEITRLKEDGSFIIRSVDFQTGESSELTGPEAEKLASVVQGGYVKSLVAF